MAERSQFWRLQKSMVFFSIIFPWSKAVKPALSPISLFAPGCRVHNSEVPAKNDNAERGGGLPEMKA